MANPPPRSVTPLIDLLRTIVRGKPQVANALRFAPKLASRTQPQPSLPGGPYNKLTEIYYYNRDARREVKPPIVVCTAKDLALGKKQETVKNLAPGKVYEPV